MLSTFVFSALLLAGCGKAPNLSFEETLKVYSEQNKIIKEVINFMNDADHQLQSNAKMKIAFENEKVMKGNSELEWESFSEKKTQNTETNASIDFSMESETTGGLGKIDANLKLNTLLKDYQIFFKLSDFNLESAQEESAGMIRAMADTFKGKWLTLNTPELTEMLQASSKNSLDLWKNEELYEINTNYYTGVESTTYDGNPAWKVDFNTEEIQKLALKMYDLSLSWNTELTSGNQELLAQQQQMKDEFKQLLSGMKFENTEAYFVIRSAKKVDFIIKNTDFSLGEMKMKLSQNVDGDIITSESLVQSSATPEQIKVKLILDNKGRWNFKINLTTEKIEDKKTEQLFELSGRIKAALTDTLFSLQPKLELKSDQLKINLEADYTTKKIDNHKFVAPTDAQDIQEVFGSLFGLGGGESLSSENEILTGEVLTGNL